MNVRVNGETLKHQGPLTIIELLKLKEVEAPEMVSVQKNGEFIDRESYESTPVSDGDDIEFLFFLGGGA